MKLCRFSPPAASPRAGLLASDGKHVIDLGAAGYPRLADLFEQPKVERTLAGIATRKLPRYALSQVSLLAPVDAQEVWAAGVTYLRSRAARMDESDFSATAYDRVYHAKRPEIFFKSFPHKVVAAGEAVGIRSDAQWSVPEPELVIVFNSRGVPVGYAVGNDMSSRDIEGENLLYLPQAKVYDRACAVGPWVTVGASEKLARKWTISLQIHRGGRQVFRGGTSIGRIKRSFRELRDYLFTAQTFPSGVLLFTGTGVVPGDQFTLKADDQISIAISGIGRLVNPVMVV